MKLIKLVLLILIIFTFNSIFSHEGESVFSHKHFQLKECRSDIDPLEPVVIKNSLPLYPRQALEKAIEANVLLEFTVNKEGNVEDPKVIWFDQTASKKDLFSRSALKAASKLKYKPGKTESGEPISTPA
ncbi:MAG: energy transducer TonB [Pseudomonadota bacterium]|nr:energy transducer TonB [Pseudomonadota bacterium]